MFFISFCLNQTQHLLYSLLFRLQFAHFCADKQQKKRSSSLHTDEYNLFICPSNLRGRRVRSNRRTRRTPRILAPPAIDTTMSIRDTKTRKPSKIFQLLLRYAVSPRYRPMDTTWQKKEDRSNLSNIRHEACIHTHLHIQVVFLLSLIDFH